MVLTARSPVHHSPPMVSVNTYGMSKCSPAAQTSTQVYFLLTRSSAGVTDNPSSCFPCRLGAVLSCPIQGKRDTVKCVCWKWHHHFGSHFTGLSSHMTVPNLKGGRNYSFQKERWTEVNLPQYPSGILKMKKQRVSLSYLHSPLSCRCWLFFVVRPS